MIHPQPCRIFGRILVVDDEPLVRMWTVDILRNAGFEIVEASSAAEALVAFGDGRSVDAVVTDVQMPGAMDGIGLAWAVHGAHADQALVIISGRVYPQPGDIPPNARFLTKPVDPTALLAEIRNGVRACPV